MDRHATAIRADSRSGLGRRSPQRWPRPAAWTRPKARAVMDVPVWALWSLAASLLLIGELLTPGLFFLGPLALAAMAATLAAALSGSAAAVVVFICGCAVSLVVLRPLARRHVRLPALSRTGA